jgi:DNA-binding MarR family transcriptional regulator
MARHQEVRKSPVRQLGAMDAYAEWSDIRDETRQTEFQAYIGKIAEARYVIRRVLRIVNEQAHNHGLDPLVHQALLQIYGAQDRTGITVSALAQRLDVAPALASRIGGQLESLGLVQRSRIPTDRRVIKITATSAGVDKLDEIDQAVGRRLTHFHQQFEEQQKLAAMSIFAFYVGMDPSSPATRAIRLPGSVNDNSA